MMITGHGGETTWFVDRFAGVLPRPWEIVLPLWLWRALLLAWSLWLAFSSMKWAVWGWNAASQGGIWPESNAEVMKAPTHPVEDVESEASESSVHDETGEEK